MSRFYIRVGDPDAFQLAPREYYEQKQVDVREAHVFATSVLNEAREAGQGWRAEMWEGERKRLAAVYAQCSDRMRRAR